MVWTRPETKNKNPFGQTQHRHGQKSEKRVLNDMGAEETIASGALPFAKSDGTTVEFRVECKSTVKESISIKHNWLTKIRDEAIETNRVPVLTISFVDAQGQPKLAGDWAVIPQHLFNEFSDFMRDYANEV